MLKRISALVLLFCMLLATVAYGEGFKVMGQQAMINDSSKWGEINTHDPAIFKDGDMYYAFSTDASIGDVHTCGIQIRKSKDLITWEYAGTAFEDYEKDCVPAIKHAKLNIAAHNGLWAPDVVKVGETYRMYYSASTFGQSRSAIGLATSTNVEGPYTDQGIVIKSDAGALNGPNCIDPAIVRDREGQLYMSYGSFSGGIFMVALDNETGFTQKGFEPVRIAGSRGAAIEASAIIYLEETDYFYLFVSYGSLSSDYNIRVARSKEITGPYLDATGMDMRSLGLGNQERVGTKLIGGFRWRLSPKDLGVMAPGHNSVLVDGDKLFLVHHMRTYALPDYWFAMQVRQMAINRFGWPVALSFRYQGEELGQMAFEPGDYLLIAHGRDSNKEAHSAQSVAIGEEQAQWETDGKISLTLDGILYDGVYALQKDELTGEETLCASLMSEDGLCIWLAKNN